MRKFIPILILMSCVISVAFKFQTQCGNERWDVKTLSDKSSSKINFTPDSSTVIELRSIPLVQTIGNTTARFGNEFEVFTIICKIREFRIEDDKDYHLVLMDMNDTTKTMIGEIPCLDCLSKSNKHYKQIKASRDLFETIKLPNHGVQSGIYRLTGTCFFDKIHGQLGVAPNGVELHPVLSIKKLK